MKILIIGLGSIGQRHLRNLLDLGYTDISVVSRAGSLPSSYQGLACYSSLEDALHAASFDAAFVCNPTAFHLNAVFPLLHSGVPHIYLEKPVSHNLERIDELVQLASSYPNRLVVGYDLHFDPGMQKVKLLLEENVIGNTVSINACVGQYLPDWRPMQDYRQGMSAQKELGGGVMLDLIHEFDYLYWLIGPAKKIACQYSHTGALDIATEDVCDVLIKFENGAIGTIHLDYLQPTLVRNCRITGQKGSIYWDLTQCRVTWNNHHQEAQSFTYEGFDRNERFVQYVQAFLSGKEDERMTCLADALESLAWVMAAKQASDKDEVIDMVSFKTQYC